MSEFNINQALRGISSRYTPGMRAEQDERNKIGRTVLNEARAQNQIALAKAQLIAVEENLQTAEEIPDPELRQARIDLLTDRKSELLAQMGNFIDAAIITPNPERRKEFQEIADAFENSDRSRCDCPDEIVVDRQRGTQIRQRSLRTVQKVINPFTNQFVAFRKCGKCGQISAG